MQNQQQQQQQKPHGCLHRLPCLIIRALHHWRAALLLCVALGAILAVWQVKRYADNGTPLVAVQHTTAIAQTPEEVRALRNIKQWEFLAVESEELIEHHEAHTLRDKHLVNIYRGTVRIGIDMQKAHDDWFSTDSAQNVTLRLPDVSLLDENFIDEARTTTFHEDGTFSAQVKQNLYHQAAETMKKHALTPENLAIAREAAKDQFSRIFTALGYQKVSISFVAEQKHDKPTTSPPKAD